MTARLIQRASARRDILALVDRISDDNPSAALSVYDAYEYSLGLLKSSPDMGRLYRSSDSRLANIRVVPLHRFHNYLIFYRHTNDTVEVLHVWHGARDIPALLADLD